MKLSSSKNTQVLLLVFLVAALLFAVYYYVVLPKQSEVDSLNRAITSLESKIELVQSTIDQRESQTKNSTPNLFTLSKQVPQSREVDKLLLNIEEIEYVTDSIVIGIIFNDYDSSAADSDLQITSPESTTDDQTGTESIQNPNTNAGALGETNTGTQDTEGQMVNESASPISSLTGTLPPELKLITFNLEVVSPNYNQLLQFIDEFEQLERIMHIDSIYYSLPGEEIQFEEAAKQTVFATIQVTTFYYDGK